MASRLDKLLAVCNEVRDAGGGDAIEALLPAVPGNDKTCLIARNLNFNCSVRPGANSEWRMYASKAVLEKVAPVLGKRTKVVRHNKRTYSVKLPTWMGRLAEDFDASTSLSTDEKQHPSLLRHVSAAKLRRVRSDCRRKIEGFRRYARDGDDYYAKRVRGLTALEAKLTQAIEAQK